MISGNTFSGDAAVFGGALSVSGLTAPLTISGNTFTNNTVTGGGGAILVVNGLPATSPVQVTGNTFTGNTAEEAGGAVLIELTHGQPVTLASNTFQANKITGSGTPLPRFSNGRGVPCSLPRYSGTPRSRPCSRTICSSTT